MVPQAFIARVREVKALMPRSQRSDWGTILALSLNDEMAREEIAAESWADVQSEALAYAHRETGILINPSLLNPF